jgi:hypothetical protein
MVMAKIRDIDQVAFDAWVATRPPVIQRLCKRLPPDRLYLIKSTGQRVTVYSWSENGTVTVDITGRYNLITFDRQVFGVDPDDLEECDFPPSDQPIGTILTDEADIEAHIDAQRAARGFPPRSKDA